MNSIEVLRREHNCTIESFLLKGKAGVRVLDKRLKEELHENYNIPFGMVLLKMLGVTTRFKISSKD